MEMYLTPQQGNSSPSSSHALPQAVSNLLLTVTLEEALGC